MIQLKRLTAFQAVGRGSDSRLPLHNLLGINTRFQPVNNTYKLDQQLSRFSVHAQSTKFRLIKVLLESPDRVCRGLSPRTCRFCGDLIPIGQAYRDGGYRRRAHLECLRRAVEKMWLRESISRRCA